jgi:hypothetical protein
MFATFGMLPSVAPSLFHADDLAGQPTFDFRIHHLSHTEDQGFFPIPPGKAFKRSPKCHLPLRWLRAAYGLKPSKRQNLWFSVDHQRLCLLKLRAGVRRSDARLLPRARPWRSEIVSSVLRRFSRVSRFIASSETVACFLLDLVIAGRMREPETGLCASPSTSRSRL